MKVQPTLEALWWPAAHAARAAQPPLQEEHAAATLSPASRFSLSDLPSAWLFKLLTAVGEPGALGLLRTCRSLCHAVVGARRTLKCTLELTLPLTDAEVAVERQRIRRAAALAGGSVWLQVSGAELSPAEWWRRQCPGGEGQPDDEMLDDLVPTSVAPWGVVEDTLRRLLGRGVGTGFVAEVHVDRLILEVSAM